MWPKFINSKWFERLFTATISIILLLFTQRLTTAREDKTEIKNELKSKATVIYVDNRDNELKEAMEKADQELRTEMNNTVVEINTNLREIRTYVIGKR